MNYNIILFLALIFGSVQPVLNFIYLYPILAQSFLRAQGLGSAESGIVLLYSEHFGLSRIRRAREKESPKRKTKPIQSQNKAKQSQFFGGFWRKNFNFSLKIDDTKLNFLCKTKPIQIYLMNITKSLYPLCPLWLSKYFQKTQKIPNKANFQIDSDVRN